MTENKSSSKQVQKKIVIVLIILVLITGTFLIFDSGIFDTPASSTSPKTQDSPIRQNLPTTQATIPDVNPSKLPVSALNKSIPPPPGPAPVGKVWSGEHGHWHDISTTGNTGFTPPPTQTTTGNTGLPTPSNASSEGMTWSTEHEHWHDASGKSITLPEGSLYPTPSVNPPAGKIWSPEHGHWHDLK